jgi:hypothetical protein
LKRLGTSLLAMTLAGLSTASAVGMDAPVVPSGAERLAMPYSCSMERGVVNVAPSIEHVYEIQGREQRFFTTCDPPFSNNCRSVAVHKFEIACGVDRVSWHRVVAAIGRTTAGDASLSKGHLVLTREAVPASGSAPSCRDRKAPGTPGGECLPWRIRKPTERLVLPQNFAPVGEVGAQFVDATFSPYSAGPSPMSNAVLPGAGPYRMTPDLTAEDPFGSVQALEVAATGDPADVATAEPGDTHGWTTSLSFAKREEAVPELIVATSSVSGRKVKAAIDSGPSMLTWVALILTGLGLATAVAAYRLPHLRLLGPDLAGAAAAARRSLRKVHDHAQGLVGSARVRLAAAVELEPVTQGQPGDPALSSALLQLRAMLARTEAAVAMLSSAAVVREVMQTELSAIRTRIEDAERAARRGSTPVMKLAAQFRQIARDIDRVQNVTHSAAQSTHRTA